MRLTRGKCDNGWICEEHPDLPWPHDDCGGPGVPCENSPCDFSSILVAAKIGDTARSRMN